MKIKTLGELCNIASGGTPSRSKSEFWNEGTIPWIKIGNIKGKYVNEADEFITQEGLENSSAKMFSKGTILYTIFATLGEVGILNIDACTNQAIAGITIKNSNELDTGYLYYYLKSKKIFVNNVGRGVAQNNINMSILRNFQMPLLKLAEQKKIVNILDMISSVIENCQKEIQKLDYLIKSRFVEIFGDPVVNPKGWNYDVMKSVCTKITDGEHGSVKRTEKGHPFLNAKHIKPSGDIDWDTITYTSDDVHERIYKRCNPEGNDIIMTTTGTIGNVAVVPVDREPFTMDRGITLLKLDKAKVKPLYIAWLLRHSAIQDIMNSNVHASAIGHLFLNKVEQIPVMLPSIEAQEEFSSFVHQTVKLKLLVQQSIETLEILSKALMQKYFG